MAPGNPFYVIATSLRFTAPLDVGILERSLNVVSARHETLRTTFTVIDGQPMQVIAPEPALTVSVLDISELSPSDREEEIVRLATAEAQRPFDLTTGPLIRATVVRLGALEHVLLLSLHHIIADGWSMRIFFSELTASYTALVAGRSPDWCHCPSSMRTSPSGSANGSTANGSPAQLTYWRHD